MRRDFGQLVLVATIGCGALTTACAPSSPAAGGERGTGEAVVAAERAHIQGARYTGAVDPNTRTEVIVSGSHFKSSSAGTSDCETRLPHHPVPDERAWKPVRRVIRADGIMYHVDVEHAAAHDVVEIRVRGSDGEWSDAEVIAK